MLSKYFIERPVLGNVIALITMLIGAVSIFGLPIAQYPPMTPPTKYIPSMCRAPQMVSTSRPAK